MTTNLWDLFNDPFFIGFNRQVARMNEVHQHSINQSYPPFNIVKIDDDNFCIDVAVAGFSKDDLSVSVEDQTLIVKGDIETDKEDNFIHKGIATRKFTRTFSLAEYIEVKSAEVENGMLCIMLEREVPEAKKPKQIKIK
jgi:molecular chaperone IbpA